MNRKQKTVTLAIVVLLRLLSLACQDDITTDNVVANTPVFVITPVPTPATAPGVDITESPEQCYQRVYDRCISFPNTTAENCAFQATETCGD